MSVFILLLYSNFCFLCLLHNLRSICWKAQITGSQKGVYWSDLLGRSPSKYTHSHPDAVDEGGALEFPFCNVETAYFNGHLQTGKNTLECPPILHAISHFWVSAQIFFHERFSCLFAWQMSNTSLKSNSFSEAFAIMHR